MLKVFCLILFKRKIIAWNNSKHLEGRSRIPADAAEIRQTWKVGRYWVRENVGYRDICLWRVLNLNVKVEGESLSWLWSCQPRPTSKRDAPSDKLGSQHNKGIYHTNRAHQTTNNYGIGKPGSLYNKGIIQNWITTWQTSKISCKPDTSN